MLMILAERRFQDLDQQRFAWASGDHNPIHVDALLARRTQAGVQVVHGIHLLLWALDTLALAQPELPPISKLRAQFNKFVGLDERAAQFAFFEGRDAFDGAAARRGDGVFERRRVFAAF